MVESVFVQYAYRDNSLELMDRANFAQILKLQLKTTLVAGWQYAIMPHKGLKEMAHVLINVLATKS